MSYSIRNVVDAESMLRYCASNLGWNLDLDAFDDIDEITYDFTARDLGLQEEAFAKIKELRQLRPVMDDQPFGVFLVTFENKSLSVSALRKILQRLTPSNYGREYKTWRSDRIIFFCFWGTVDRRTIGFAAFENPVDGSCSAFKILYCTPAIEDYANCADFENKLSLLKWPTNIEDHDAWYESWHKAFTTSHRQVILDTRNLVEALASVASRLKADVLMSLKDEDADGQLHTLWLHLRGLLGDIYTAENFADMFAQALVYGFLTARCLSRKEAVPFTVQTALASCPLTNPLLKEIIDFCCREENEMMIDLSLVNEVVSVLDATKIDQIVSDFNRQTSMGRMVEDPIVCFYEQFLDSYEREQRKIMGEYFTPFPAADFMVRSVEYFLKNIFNIESGFCDDQVSVLDPGTGTATCLRDIILRTHVEFLKTHTQSEWNRFVEESLLPRISGYELMIAPYAIAHLKLTLALQETGYCASKDVVSRIGVYLKNSLRPYPASPNRASLSPIAEAINKEVYDASQIYYGSIRAIIGGPPFRENSWNKEPWIGGLLQDYKKEPNTEDRINERNLRPLNNDYVKFVRYAQEATRGSANAVIAYLLPHTYIDNLTFRCMRWSILSEFSEIYILDLHGNALGQGRAADQNIFDIQQGVCVTIMVKRPKAKGALADVYYSEVVGTREKKFDFLRTKSIPEIEWRKLTPTAPSYFMSPRGMSEKSAHIEWINLAQLFPVSKVGVKTHHDNELISKSQFDTPYDQLYAYRPFDIRHINYDRTKVERDRYEVVRHFIGHRNLGLVIDRQVMADNWSHFQVVEHMIDNRLHYSRKGNPYLCPVYLFDQLGNKTLNLNRQLVSRFEQATGLAFSEVETSNDNEFDVLALIDYAYAILYCNVFRHKFAAVLSLDFPSIPLPSSRKAFRAFSEQGSKLRELHSYGASVPNDLAIIFEGEANCTFQNFKWEDDKAYIGRQSYLYPVPEFVWNYCFGGYRGLQKWLADRRGEVASSTDIDHMINVFNIFAKSIDLSKFIDSLAFDYFNGFEDDSVSINYSFTTASSQEAEYVIQSGQTEWRDAAHRPTGGFTAD